jgi:hypothetical protein
MNRDGWRRQSRESIHPVGCWPSFPSYKNKQNLDCAHQISCFLFFRSSSQLVSQQHLAALSGLASHHDIFHHFFIILRSFMRQIIGVRREKGFLSFICATDLLFFCFHMSFVW